MEESILTFTQDIENVVFEKEELEFQSFAEIKAILSLPAFQDCNSVV